MKLQDMVKALNSAKHGQHVLIYGDAKSGKTFYAAGIARVPQIKRVLWFDFERGVATLAHPDLKLTSEQQAKFEIIQTYSDAENPYAIETALKLMEYARIGRAFKVCEDHGRIDCPQCRTKSIEVAPIDEHTAIVLDSLTAISDAAYAVAERQAKGSNNKYAVFGEQGNMLKHLLERVQHARCNIVAITHALVAENETTGKEQVFPLCGTRAFSSRVGRFFDHVVFRSVELRNFKAGSTPTYKVNVLAGSRTGVKAEDNAEAGVEIFWK